MIGSNMIYISTICVEPLLTRHFYMHQLGCVWFREENKKREIGEREYKKREKEEK
jgi:hypothetical protein